VKDMNMAPTGPLGQPLSGTAADLGSLASQTLAASNAALIRGFPPDPDQYIAFLRTLGQPLDNYGAGSRNTAYALHPSINVVRCTAGPASAARVQERGGPLPPHSARAFSAHRPRYIAMFMIDPGWPAPAGEAGESVIVRWTDALRHMLRASPRTYDEDYALLTQTPITITAQHVTDQWATTPLIYPLPDASNGDDVGARYSLALTDQLPVMPMDNQLRERYAAAADRFARAASDPSVRFTYPMRAGEIIILDNNRYGHGRLTFPRTRPGPGTTTEISPRELWSVVIA